MVLKYLMRQIEDNIRYGGQKMSAQDMLVERIDNLCKERNMSYYTLSYNSTVPLTTLMHIMNKSTLNPGIITISKICDEIGRAHV